MEDLNSICMVGRLTSDSELKEAGSTKVLTFSIACNESMKKGDSWEDVASFFTCKQFGKLAEGIAPYMKKGQKVALRGRLRQDRWEKDGQKQSKIVIIVEDINLVGGRPSEGAQEAPQQQQNTQSLLGMFTQSIPGAQVVPPYPDEIPY